MAGQKFAGNTRPNVPAIKNQKPQKFVASGFPSVLVLAQE